MQGRIDRHSHVINRIITCTTGGASGARIGLFYPVLTFKSARRIAGDSPGPAAGPSLLPMAYGRELSTLRGSSSASTPARCCRSSSMRARIAGKSSAARGRVTRRSSSLRARIVTKSSAARVRVTFPPFRLRDHTVPGRARLSGAATVGGRVAASAACTESSAGDMTVAEGARFPAAAAVA
jgi:hypothetical protein